MGFPGYYAKTISFSFYYFVGVIPSALHYNKYSMSNKPVSKYNISLSVFVGTISVGVVQSSVDWPDGV